MTTTHILLVISWILYCFTHSFLANETIKKHIQSRLNLKMNVYRIWYNIVAFILLVAVVIYQLRIKSIMLFQVPFINNLISIILMVIGGAIMFLSIIKYFSQFSGFKGHTKQDLQRSGLHKYVRHPLYLGTFIFLIGLFFWRPLLSNGLAIGIIIIYTLAGIRLEEKKLIDIYGNEYRDYKKNVPGILPRLWARRRFVK